MCEETSEIASPSLRRITDKVPEESSGSFYNLAYIASHEIANTDASGLLLAVIRNVANGKRFMRGAPLGPRILRWWFSRKFPRPKLKWC